MMENVFYGQKHQNRFYKPITLVKEIPMVKFKKQKNVLNIGVLLDRSGSMGAYKVAAIESVNAQLESFRNEAKKSGIETRLTVQTFASETQPVEIDAIPIQESGELDVNSYSPWGGTALRDAMGEMIDRLPSVLANGNMNLLLVITDGEELHSKKITQAQLFEKVKTCIATDRWTFAVCVPPGYGNQASIQTGIPRSCITEWESSAKGLERLSTQVTMSNTALFNSYSKGVTRSASYFQPDLNNLNPTLLQTNLVDVSDKYSIHFVYNDAIISPFVTLKTNRAYTVGSAFYELQKKEKVQDYKDIILLDNKSNRLYTGAGIRSLLRLPEGVTVELTPALSTDYTIFVKSTSWNRKLKANSRVLITR